MILCSFPVLSSPGVRPCRTSHADPDVRKQGGGRKGCDPPQRKFSGRWDVKERARKPPAKKGNSFPRNELPATRARARPPHVGRHRELNYRGAKTLANPNPNPCQSTLHPTPSSPSIPPLTQSSPPKSTKNHATNTTKPCKSTPTNPPSPTQTIQYSFYTPQQISLSIYSTSYTFFSIYSSSNPIFISKIHKKSRHQHHQTM